MCFVGTSQTVSSEHVLIMDEVDGMAGNEDRGGIQVNKLEGMWIRLTLTTGIWTFKKNNLIQRLQSSELF